MVERYNQGELASSRTPLPTEDHSASQAAMLISQAADKQRDMIMSTAVGHLARAEGKFNQMQGFANQLASSLKATKGVGDEERRRLQVALAHRDENDLAEQTFNSYRQKYADNPDAALAAFEADKPQMRQAFQSRYEADPVAFRMLLPVHDGLERETKGRLEAWAQKAANSKLEGRLNLLPEEMASQIGSFQGSVDEQFHSFQNLLKSADATYMEMYKSAQDPGTQDGIKLQHMKLGRKLSQDFVSHLVAQTPDGEQGLKYIDNLSNVVQNAHALGLPLSPDDQKSAVDTLRTVRADSEKDILLGVQTEGNLKLLSVNRYKADIYAASAAGDKKELTRLSTEIKGHLDGLNQRIEQVGQEPDSTIKKAKLVELKKEQNSLISEIGMELNQQRTLVNIQNSITRMAWAAAGQQRALVTFARGNFLFAQSQADRTQRLEDKSDKLAASIADEKRIDSFNKDWSNVIKDTRSMWALPAGEQQQAVMQGIANKAVPILNKALKAGTIDATSYKNYLDEVDRNMQNVRDFKTSKPANFFGVQLPWGGGQTVQLSGKERAKAREAAQQDFGKTMQKHGALYDDLDTAFGMLNTQTLSKREKAVMTQYMDEKLPSFFRNERYQSAKSPQRAQLTAAWINAKLNDYRKGKLK